MALINLNHRAKNDCILESRYVRHIFFSFELFILSEDAPEELPDPTPTLFGNKFQSSFQEEEEESENAVSFSGMCFSFRYSLSNFLKTLMTY